MFVTSVLLQDSDAGEYECLASNDAGTSKGVVSLTLTCTQYFIHFFIYLKQISIIYTILRVDIIHVKYKPTRYPFLCSIHITGGIAHGNSHLVKCPCPWITV